MYDLVKVGSKIEDFAFNVYHNKDITNTSFTAFRGKWLVVFFYPADFTFICPTELESLADNYSEFVNEGAEILSFSRDSAFVHKAWHESDQRIGKINFPMASDITGDVTSYFDVFEESNGLSLRGTFIINPEGTLVSAEINDNSIGRNTHEILRKLRAAKFTAANKGQVCPVNWDKGKEALTLPKLSILDE